jgi:signal transduction histidine kinase
MYQAARRALSSSDRKVALDAFRAIAKDPLHSPLSKLLATVPSGIAQLNVARSSVSEVIQGRAATLVDDANARERDYAALTGAAVLLAIALLWLTNRWITRPLRALADEAGAVASVRLPAAVRQILETPLADEVVRPEIAPVHVRAGGEVREVEAALNRVQDRAIELALEQAALRRNVSEVYVNLGRRNQNLLARQLEFITQLERDESDPETLENLFRLDHLATRMRRNAESLLVLAGHAAPRTWSAPVEIGDVVRGALGEIEGYRRIRLRHLDDAQVDGAAAADLSHVLAELAENAVTFSPPDVDVEIYGRRDDFGYVLTVVDCGIGMGTEETGRANRLFASVDTVDVAPSRYLGHYVVAQLAARYGLGVHLAASPAGGITATVAVPMSLLGGAAAPEAEPVRDVDDVDDVDEPVVAALPRRGAPPEPDSDAVFAVLAEPETSEVVPEPPSVALEPELVPEPPQPSEELPPALSPRHRLGVGSFADLRATPGPEIAPPPREPTPDPVEQHHATFAAVADAVDVTLGRTPFEPSAPDYSGDLLPQKLPKRGRRASRLATPWTRERPVRDDGEPPVTSSADERVAMSGAPGALRFGPPLDAPEDPGANETTRVDASEPASAIGSTDDRFAFFAAFRAAAERAREEAGIEDSRGGS